MICHTNHNGKKYRVRLSYGRDAAFIYWDPPIDSDRPLEASDIFGAIHMVHCTIHIDSATIKITGFQKHIEETEQGKEIKYTRREIHLEHFFSSEQIEAPAQS